MGNYLYSRFGSLEFKLLDIVFGYWQRCIQLGVIKVSRVFGLACCKRRYALGNLSGLIYFFSSEFGLGRYCVENLELPFRIGWKFVLNTLENEYDV